jgi:hypothetical protein
MPRSQHGPNPMMGTAKKGVAVTDQMPPAVGRRHLLGISISAGRVPAKEFRDLAETFEDEEHRWFGQAGFQGVVDKVADSMTPRPRLPHADVHQDGHVGRKPGPIRRRRGTLRGALLPTGSHRAGEARQSLCAAIISCCARQLCRKISCHNDFATTTPWAAQQMGFNSCAAATRPLG